MKNLRGPAGSNQRRDPGAPAQGFLKKENMYFILENCSGSFYTEALANDEFPSLQAAEKKLQALEELKPKGKFFIVTDVVRT